MLLEVGLAVVLAKEVELRECLTRERVDLWPAWTVFPPSSGIFASLLTGSFCTVSLAGKDRVARVRLLFATIFSQDQNQQLRSSISTSSDL